MKEIDFQLLQLDGRYFLTVALKKELGQLEPNLPCPGPALDNFSSPVIIH